MEYARRLAGAASAPGAQRVYLNTLLFFTTSAVLLFIAAAAYPVFYYNYVPEKLVSIPVHLQYNAGPNPFGIVTLPRELMPETAYDVAVELTLPRSPTNTHRGNFMLGLFAVRSELPNPAVSWELLWNPYAHVQASDVVFASRRPALVPYQDPLVRKASRVALLPWHLLFPDDAESLRLTVAMGELVEFRGRLPVNLLLDVQAGQDLQVYAARVELVARLTGIRWAMYNHRVLSFLVFTSLFWLAEMLSMGLAWLVLAHWVGGAAAQRRPKEVAPYDAFTSGTEGPSGPLLSTTSGTEGTFGVRSASNPDSEYHEVKREEGEEGQEETRVKEESVERDMPTRTVKYQDEGEGTGSSYRKGKMVQRRSRDASGADEQ